MNPTAPRDLARKPRFGRTMTTICIDDTLAEVGTRLRGEYQRNTPVVLNVGRK